MRTVNPEVVERLGHLLSLDAAGFEAACRDQMSLHLRALLCQPLLYPRKVSVVAELETFLALDPEELLSTHGQVLSAELRQALGSPGLSKFLEGELLHKYRDMEGVGLLLRCQLLRDAGVQWLLERYAAATVGDWASWLKVFGRGMSPRAATMAMDAAWCLLSCKQIMELLLVLMTEEAYLLVESAVLWMGWNRLLVRLETRSRSIEGNFLTGSLINLVEHGQIATLTQCLLAGGDDLLLRAAELMPELGLLELLPTSTSVEVLL